MQVLQSATSKPTRFLGLSKLFGTIEKGKIANPILLEVNPLDNVGNTKKIAIVIINGRSLSKETVQEMLRSKAQR